MEQTALTTRAEEIAGPYRAEVVDPTGWWTVSGPGASGMPVMSKDAAVKFAERMNIAYKQGHQDRWIPLSERYPERGSRFILWDAQKKQASPGIFTHDMDEVNWTERYGFTHWCEYPSPPNPEQR